jgi:cytochrome c6
MNIVLMFFLSLTASLSLLTSCTASDQPGTGGEAKMEAVNTATSTGQVKETAAETGSTAGADLFEQHCAVCHSGGGNIVNKQKTLYKDVRESNGIKSTDDIIKIMRNPGPGMSAFDKTAISDKDAKEIADYILKTF